MAGSIVRAQNLHKKFKDLSAVDGVSFDILEGECFGFLGQNGAGKTTTVKMIHCVSPPSSGSLMVFGLPAGVNRREIKRHIGVIPQESNLDADLTVYENLYLFSNYFDMDRREAEKKIEELLDFAELGIKRKCKIDELSTGMKRRLVIARALINSPRLIIADEPTTGLDPQARHLIWQRLRELRRRGATMILTTQYMEEAEQLCDRLVIMDKGRIIARGSPAGLIAGEIGKDVIEIRIDSSFDEKITGSLAGLNFDHERVGDTLYLYCRDGQSILKKVVEMNFEQVLHRPASLEDVFLKLTGRSLTE